jgi:hypothetical protein
MSRATDRTYFNAENILGRGLNSQPYSETDKTAIETALNAAGNTNVKAKVIYALGDNAGAVHDNVKIKFYNRGLMAGTYRSRNFAQADAIAFKAELVAANP